MSRNSVRPLVGIPGNIIRLREHSIPQHASGERYITAASRGARVTPIVIPALGEEHDVAGMAERLDGLLLSGGRANVEPHHYGGPPFPDDEIRDPARDATVLPLVRACVDAGVPVFGICRGMQEMNVALGGSLHYRVHLVEGKMDHRMKREGTMDERFALRHMVSLAPGGFLRGLVDDEEVKVNSAHGQGVDRLADGVEVEATAPDGIIEAFRVTGAKRFAVGVQWHAEWRYDEHELATKLFEAFGDAARDRARKRGG